MLVCTPQDDHKYHKTHHRAAQKKVQARMHLPIHEILKFVASSSSVILDGGIYKMVINVSIRGIHCVYNDGGSLQYLRVEKHRSYSLDLLFFFFLIFFFFFLIFGLCCCVVHILLCYMRHKRLDRQAQTHTTKYPCS